MYFAQDYRKTKIEIFEIHVNWTKNTIKQVLFRHDDRKQKIKKAGRVSLRPKNTIKTSGLEAKKKGTQRLKRIGSFLNAKKYSNS